eukprot:TRINITY_DN26490_c0_g1_i1.p1 TRINITY_DN26490_c0_g1~~TRINITY_DN26490_c0_g1_i1.p1  ORF type:complete len:1065 (-),score=169.97 TRINITY_DN26490_c0_g1_i1:106-3204(-)
MPGGRSSKNGALMQLAKHENGAIDKQAANVSDTAGAHEKKVERDGTIYFGILGAFGPGALVVRLRAARSGSDLGHLAWYAAYVEAYRDVHVPQLRNTTYLDYAGAALSSRPQITAAADVLSNQLFANPHTSVDTSEMISRARDEVLALFNVTSRTHSIVFTSGATQSLQLVGEHFTWSPGGFFLYPDESHTSVLGIRQQAFSGGGVCGCYALEDLGKLQHGVAASKLLAGAANGCWHGSDADFAASSAPATAAPVNLLAVTGESNFSGVRADLTCIAGLRDGPYRWRVLLDAAKLACTPGLLDLASCPADFTAVSFYKMFGYPTGLGALIVRHDAAPLLSSTSSPLPPASSGFDSFEPEVGNGVTANSLKGSAVGLDFPNLPLSSAKRVASARPLTTATYFGGGAVEAVSASSFFVVPRAGLVERLERGTPHFSGIATLPSQIEVLRRCLGPDAARRLHALAVCREAYLRTRALCHRTCWDDVVDRSDGCSIGGRNDGSGGARSLCEVLGRHETSGWTECQGPTMAVLLYFADGAPIPYGLVARRARAHGILLRAGCHCNVGACQKYLALSDEDVRRQHANGKVCGDDMSLFEGRPIGAIRVSFGDFSTLADVDQWIAFLQNEFLDHVECPGGGGTMPVGVVAIANGVVSVGSGGTDTSAVPLPKISAELPPPPLERVGHVVGVKIYPIKGCGPLLVRRWPIDPATGALFLDRRWCLQRGLGESNGQPASRRRASQRHLLGVKQAPRLAQVRVALQHRPGQTDLILTVRGEAIERCPAQLRLPLTVEDAKFLRDSGATVEVEEDAAVEASASPLIATEVAGTDGASCWFEALLGIPELRLIIAPIESPLVGGRTAGEGDGEDTIAPGNHANATPEIAAPHFANKPSTLLLVSTTSLQEFSRICGVEAPSDRFRANLEVCLDEPFQEAAWPQGCVVQVGETELAAAGRCIRCRAIDTDPEVGRSASGPSLLGALSTARPGHGGVEGDDGGDGGGTSFGVLLRCPRCVIVANVSDSPPAFSFIAVGGSVLVNKV